MGWSGLLFNSVDLSTLPGVDIHTIDHHKRPVRLNNWQKLTRAHGKKLTNGDYGEKLIVVGLTLSGTSRANYEANRDNLLKYLEVQEATLRFPVAGANRDFTASVDDVDYPQMSSGGFAEVLIKFIASNPPFGVDTSNTTLVNTIRTGASATETFVALGGTIDAEPVITVTLNSGTGLTSKYIKITNPASGKYVQVTRTWIAGDVLVIDVINKTVKVNGTAVDWLGSWPTYAPTDTQLTREDDFTTRNITVNMVAKRRWL